MKPEPENIVDPEAISLGLAGYVVSEICEKVHTAISS